MNANGLEVQKALLLDLLRYSYEGFAWHGPNLMHALRGVGLEQAAWRPASQRAVWNVHEITLHVGDIMQKCSAELFARVCPEKLDQNAFPPVVLEVTGPPGSRGFLDAMIEPA
jgi:hypothetical protein